MRFRIRVSLPWLLAMLCVGAAGCAAQRNSLHRPTYAGFHSESIPIQLYSSDSLARDRMVDLSPLLAELNASYVRAEQEERLGLECCVDHYYDAAIRGWQYIESAQGNACDPGWTCAVAWIPRVPRSIDRSRSAVQAIRSEMPADGTNVGRAGLHTRRS